MSYTVLIVLDVEGDDEAEALQIAREIVEPRDSFALHTVDRIEVQS